ncbi:MAG TPA: PaaI family thioesterase [Oxalicibacterium sp.]|uniref:PaaI family thioesterase n=1 Tax=Oxalicibacterium sp. TaxID=2766525 RepID=UPI002C379E40|nr:PaaI family thioesterase [Oxalicibacterium sp.]HWU98542.1 PaaI family thioesterase [Oxalicibacterium sp.]
MTNPVSPSPILIPFLQELGIEVVESNNGTAQVQLTLQKRHLNSWHVAHGGVIMTMLDNVMSLAGRSLDPEIRSGVTIEMKTSFMQPGGIEGGRLIAKGKVMHASSSIYFCEGELWNDDRLVAKATGTFKFIRRNDVAKKMNPA